MTGASRRTPGGEKRAIGGVWSGLFTLLLGAAVVAAGCSSSQKKAPADPSSQVPAAAPAEAAGTAPPPAAPAAAPEPQAPESGVYGTVLSGGTPVAGATVMIPELNAKHAVQADGTFSIELEPTGKLRTVIFTASGFLPVTKKISVPRGQPVRLSIELTR